ncbi:hypothetical protein OIV83_005619 [Microbotryomycetes sp. JL201]|nr:hypothetical protein OIV83_005619 [Microbotryomycetes sp. JL201]
MLLKGSLGVSALLALTRFALAAPSKLESESVEKRAPDSGLKPACNTRYGPKSSAEGAVPANPQTATTACPIYANQTIEIPVFTYIPYFKNKTVANNYLTTTQLMKGINDMNRIYSQYKPRIQFKLQTPKYKQVTSAAAWEAYFYADESEDQRKSEAQIIPECLLTGLVSVNELLTIPARGPLSSRGPNQMRQLWLYLLPAISDGSLAFAFIPESRFPFLHDGVYIDTKRWFVDQATLAHEVGHWLRLQHTFEGGCTGTDFVSDTPPWKLDFADKGSLLCKGSTGYDWNKISNPCGRSKGEAIKNIKNIMSYSDDRCQFEFTWGQRKRFWEAAVNYRVFKPVCGPVK